MLTITGNSLKVAKQQVIQLRTTSQFVLDSGCIELLSFSFCMKISRYGDKAEQKKGDEKMGNTRNLYMAIDLPVGNGLQD